MVMHIRPKKRTSGGPRSCCSADGLGDRRDHAADGPVEALRLALAGALGPRGWKVSCATRRGRRASRRSGPKWRSAWSPDANGSAGRGDPLDRRDDGEGRRHQRRSVQRIWRAHRPQPHRVRQFKLSNDPQFVAKLRDIVGSLQPAGACHRALGRQEKPDPGARPDPARAADEEGPRRHHDPRLQAERHDDALRRAERPGRNRHRPQHGPPSPPGVHPLPQRRRNRSLADKPVTAILDNYAAHKHPKVRQWLQRHPRWTFHFVPTFCWLNAVEGFFAKLAKAASSAASFAPSSNSRPPSTASSKSTTPNRSPSPGPPIRSASSLPSDEGTNVDSSLQSLREQARVKWNLRPLCSFRSVVIERNGRASWPKQVFSGF